VNIDSSARSPAAAPLGSTTVKIFLALLATVTLLGVATAPTDAAAYYYHGHRYAYRHHGHYYRYHYHHRYYNYRTCHPGHPACTYW
jgi:hypothetical protein